MKIVINGDTVDIPVGNSGIPTVPLTQAEYDALTDDEKNAEKLYLITDAAASGSDSEEVYSTEETRIGTWIDGKPLYRRMVVGRLTAINTSTVAGDAIPDVDVVTYLGAITLLTNGGWCPFPYPPSTSVWAVCQFHTSDNKVHLMTNNSVFTGHDVYIEMRYTKTTDTATRRLT